MWKFCVHVELLLVRLHAVQTTHQAAIVAIQATTYVSTGKNKIKPEHAPSLGVIFRFLDIESELDGSSSIQTSVLVNLCNPPRVLRVLCLSTHSDRS